jgi:hypothetical protein
MRPRDESDAPRANPDGSDDGGSPMDQFRILIKNSNTYKFEIKIQLYSCILYVDKGAPGWHGANVTDCPRGEH